MFWYDWNTDTCPCPCWRSGDPAARGAAASAGAGRPLPGMRRWASAAASARAGAQRSAVGAARHAEERRVTAPVPWARLPPSRPAWQPVWLSAVLLWRATGRRAHRASLSPPLLLALPQRCPWQAPAPVQPCCPRQERFPQDSCSTQHSCERALRVCTVLGLTSLINTLEFQTTVGGEPKPRIEWLLTMVKGKRDGRGRPAHGAACPALIHVAGLHTLLTPFLPSALAQRGQWEETARGL